MLFELAELLARDRFWMVGEYLLPLCLAKPGLEVKVLFVNAMEDGGAPEKVCGWTASSGRELHLPKVHMSEAFGPRDDDSWWEHHTRDREQRRDLDLAWREYSLDRIESRETTRKRRSVKRPRDGESFADRRLWQRQLTYGQPASPEPQRQMYGPPASPERPQSEIAAASPTSSEAARHLASLLSRLCDLAATGCGGCERCAACLAVARCKRCEQCSVCYEAATITAQQQSTLLHGLAQGIAALRPSQSQQLTHHLPGLLACDGWEAAWEAGKATASFDQQLQALWERSKVVISCLDWQTTASVLPPALQEAARRLRFSAE